MNWRNRDVNGAKWGVQPVQGGFGETGQLAPFTEYSTTAMSTSLPWSMRDRQNPPKSVEVAPRATFTTSTALNPRYALSDAA